MTASPSTTCITQVQDNSGRTVSYTYDANGRLTAVTNPAGGKTTYTWAACTTAMTCTELLSITDPDGHVTSNSYDPTTGRVTSQTDGDRRHLEFSYTTNSSGQITQTDVTDPRGIKDAYSFDANGYLSSVTDAAGTSAAQTTTAVFDPTTNLLTSETDPLGRTTNYTYDAWATSPRSPNSPAQSTAATWSFTYDPVYNRVTSITDPLGHTTTIAYNDTAHTETVTDAARPPWVLTAQRRGPADRGHQPAGPEHLPELPLRRPGRGGQSAGPGDRRLLRLGGPAAAGHRPRREHDQLHLDAARRTGQRRPARSAR